MAYPDLTATQMSYRNSTTLGTSVDDTNDMGKLWLPIWSGEVLHAYDQFRMFEPMVTSKSISSGRTIEFPITGTVNLKAAWDAGEYLVGGDNSASSQFTIELDKRPMAAHFELDNIDLMVTQWEYRQELARQAGQTLANARDKQVAAYIALAAASAKIADDPRTLDLPDVFAVSAAVIDDAAEALKVLEGIEEFCVDLQMNDVPVQGCYCVVTPRLFQQIRRLGVADAQAEAVSMQPMFGGVAMAGGLGAPLTQGMNSLSDSLVYMGVTITKSNHIPTANYAANAIGETRYNVQGAAGNVRGMIFCAEAVAAVRKTGLVVDTEDDIRRNTTFTVASMYSGTGVLKPELAKLLVGGVAVPVTSRLAALAALTGTATDTAGQAAAAAETGYVKS